MTYKLLHKPTGYFYRPHLHGGSNLSPHGKVYQTATHGLSQALRHYKKSGEFSFCVYVDQDSRVYQKTKDILKYEECQWSYKQMKAPTDIMDWQILNVITGNLHDLL